MVRSRCRRSVRHGIRGLVSAALILWLALPLATAFAAPSTLLALPADASCARLAATNPTATNGPLWGSTALVGFGQAGGWFGVPVCANDINLGAPGGANVSCDRVPVDMVTTGCAPGAATADGYGWTFQCVELVARFATWAFRDAPTRWQGDAPYLWLANHHPVDFTPEANGGLQPPRPGDILVWGSLDFQGRPWPEGPVGGHVAIVSAVSADAITFVEQNMLGHHDGVAFN